MTGSWVFYVRKKADILGGNKVRDNIENTHKLGIFIVASWQDCLQIAVLLFTLNFA
jgi:hypothetical protein